MPQSLKTCTAWLLASLLQIALLHTALAQAAPAAHAASPVLRIASAFDPQTLDPHAVALLYHTRVVYQVYDSLVNRDQAFKIEPAPSWNFTPGRSLKRQLVGLVFCQLSANAGSILKAWSRLTSES